MRVVRQIDDHFVNSMAALFRRMGAVEAWRNTQQHPDIDFSEPGAISTGVWPPKKFPAPAGYVVGMVVLLGTAGTSTTTIQLRKNGSVVTGSAVSLGSGVTSNSVTLTAPGTAFLGPYTDILYPECTAAGAGAQDLTVHVQWRPAR